MESWLAPKCVDWIFISPDGSNWHDLILIAAVSSDSQEIAFAATAAFPHTRAKIVASSVTSGADVRVDLHHN